VRCRNFDVSESRSEIPGKFRNVVLEEDGEDHLDRLCKKLICIAKNQVGEKYPTDNKKRRGVLDWSHPVYELFYMTRYWKEG